MCQGLNSHYFHIIGDGHQPNSRGLYPIIRIPIKGGLMIPNIATFDHGTDGYLSQVDSRIFVAPMVEHLCSPVYSFNWSTFTGKLEDSLKIPTIGAFWIQRYQCSKIQIQTQEFLSNITKLWFVHNNSKL